jgi:hypothetical protein
MSSEDRYSSTSGLTEEEKRLVEMARADYARIDSTPEEQRSKLPPEKQDFPVGIRPDGSVNSADEGGAQQDGPR